MMDVITEPLLTLATPIGNIRLRLASNRLLGVTFTDAPPCDPSSLCPPSHRIALELERYFATGNHHFECPLTLDGTPFQQRVWRALQAIPCGQLLTYGELAKQLQTSPRAIGNACRANPIPIIIPCHRIVGQNSLVGYSGDTNEPGLRIKRFLIDLEQNAIPIR